MPKSIFKSKTFWVNLLTLLIALAPPVRDFIVQLGFSSEIVVSIVAVLNIVLRLLTNQPVKVK